MLSLIANPPEILSDAIAQGARAVKGLSWLGQTEKCSFGEVFENGKIILLLGC